MKQVEVYTDGACSGNPGPGGWGAVLRYRFNGKVYEKELSGGDDSTTSFLPPARARRWRTPPAW